MKRIKFQLWGKDFLKGLADHTSVKCIDESNPGNSYVFQCWGGDASTGLKSRLLAEATGLIDVALLYRYPIDLPDKSFPDTAGIGLYGINGVCHQSANCFLYSTEPRISGAHHVHGYWLSSWLYGTFGTDYPKWEKNVYKKCLDTIEGVKSAISGVRGIYKSADNVDMKELIVQDVKYTTEQAVASGKYSGKFSHDSLEKLHRSFLNDMEGMVEKRGIKREFSFSAENDSTPTGDMHREVGNIAVDINNRCRQLQRDIRKEISNDELYKKLNGISMEEEITEFDIIDISKYGKN